MERASNGAMPRDDRARAGEVGPALVRVAGDACFRTAGWGARPTLRAGRRLAGAAVGPESPVALARGGGAECMRPERAPAYLSNLYRLGLVWFSRESLPDPAPCRVLEAQPEAVKAVRGAGRARVVRRSIGLTPFGGHFCESRLPLEDQRVRGAGA